MNEVDGEVPYFGRTSRLHRTEVRGRGRRYHQLEVTAAHKFLVLSADNTATPNIRLCYIFSSRMVVDLENRTICGVDSSIFLPFSKELNAALYNNAIQAISQRVPVTLEMTSVAPVTDFNNFSLLKGVWNALRYAHDLDMDPYTITKRIMPKSAANGKCNILIRLVLDDLSVKPRIKPNDLICIMCDPGHKICDGTNLIIALCTREGDEPNHTTASITFSELRRRLFVLFTDLLCQITGDRWPWLPDICIDEIGVIVSPALDHPSADVETWFTIINGEPFLELVE
jgi:hypothetical protein